MSLQLSISDSVLSTIRIPKSRLEQALLQELFSFAKDRELAQISKYEFGQLLGQRGVLRHYATEELEDDLSYARSE